MCLPHYACLPLEKSKKRLLACQKPRNRGDYTWKKKRRLSGNRSPNRVRHLKLRKKWCRRSTLKSFITLTTTESFRGNLNSAQKAAFGIFRSRFEGHPEKCISKRFSAVPVKVIGCGSPVPRGAIDSVLHRTKTRARQKRAVSYLQSHAWKTKKISLALQPR